MPAKCLLNEGTLEDLAKLIAATESFSISQLIQLDEKSNLGIQAGDTKWRELLRCFQQAYQEKHYSKVILFLESVLDPRGKRYSALVEKQSTVSPEVINILNEEGFQYDEKTYKITFEGINVTEIYSRKPRLSELKKDVKEESCNNTNINEACKRLIHTIQKQTGNKKDGVTLIKETFFYPKDGGKTKNPRFVINTFKTSSQQNAQTGFGNLLLGTIQMFRNTTSHELTSQWKIKDEDYEKIIGFIDFLVSTVRKRTRPLNQEK